LLADAAGEEADADPESDDDSRNAPTLVASTDDERSEIRDPERE
jgi:hypothetical protein